MSDLEKAVIVTILASLTTFMGVIYGTMESRHHKDICPLYQQQEVEK